ncbi:unnamed protein product [Prorocentrum cordatum]|uniref:Uncharacterized protein n=1 Tax=Prorocentrum cordatum TaxID=2364126 RepID=A0ABN9XTU4_9DINO|nr:unnamed protein product [Polarella glacialis]
MGGLPFLNGLQVEPPSPAPAAGGGGAGPAPAAAEEAATVPVAQAALGQGATLGDATPEDLSTPPAPTPEFRRAARSRRRREASPASAG